MTDYASRTLTLHYGAVAVKEPREADAQEACRILGQRLAEWCAVYCHGRKAEHPGGKLAQRRAPQ